MPNKNQTPCGMTNHEGQTCFEVSGRPDGHCRRSRNGFYETHFNGPKRPVNPKAVCRHYPANDGTGE